MAESEVEEGVSNRRHMCKFALAVTLLLDHSYLLIAKFLSPGLARGVITLCLRPAW